MASGSFPFWNPRIAAGQPLAANPAYETFYPFHWTIFLPDFDLGFRLAVILHFYLAAIGTYLLLRSLRCRIAPALFGAVTLVLGGTFLSLTNLLPFLFSVTWLPWIGYFWVRSNIPLAALSLGMLLLAADQSMIVQAGALLVAYGVYRKGWRSLVTSAIVIALAILVGSAQIIPALDHQRDSVRSQPLPYNVAASWSLGPQRPLEMLFPNLDSWYSPDLTLVWSHKSHPEFPLPLVLNYYPGLLAGVLILAGLIARVRGWVFVATWSGCSYLLALGRFGPLFRFLYDAGVRSIRYPEKFFVSAIFVLSIFAAIVAEELDRNEALRRIALMVCGTIVIVSIALWAASHATSYATAFASVWGESNSLFITASRRGWMLSSVMSAILLTLLFIRPRAGLLAIFVLIDLGMRIGGLTPRIEREYFDPPPIARLLQSEHRPIRIYNDALWSREHNRLPLASLRERWWAIRNGMIPRMEEIWGFEGIFDGDFDLTNLLPSHELTRAFLAAPAQRRPLLLALAAVSEVGVIAPREPSTFSNPREYTYVRFTPFPGNARFYFADQLIAARDFVRALSSQATISTHAAFVETPFPPASGRVVRAIEHPNAIDLDVESAANALLVIAVTRHKYWQATIDGVPAVLHPTNIAFQSVVVPRGRHHVALRYRNPLIVIFGIVSIVSAAALLAIAVGGGFRSRAPRPPSQR